MGPVPIPKDVLQTLKNDPDNVTWTKRRGVIVYKGREGGLRIKYCFFQGKRDSYMIITKVKDDCCIRTGVLKIFDRIIAINSENIVSYSKDKVIGILKHIQEADVILTVTYPNVKDILRIKSDGKAISDNCYSSGLSKEIESKEFRSGENAENPFISRQESSEYNYTSGESLNLETYSYELREHKEPSIDCGMETGAVFYNSNVLTHNRHSDESCETILSGDASQNEPRQVRRGLRQISESNSNQSVNSNCPLLREEDMPRSKSDNKPMRQQIKTDIIDSPGGSELEPLNRMNLLSPTSTSKLSYLTVEDMSRAHSLPLTKDSAVSMQDINVFEEHTQSLPVGHASHCTGSSESRMCYNCQTKPGGRPTNTNVGVMLESHEPLSEDYRNFLLKNPHLAVWDGMNTHVVEIDKGSAKEFGFHYKVMIGKNQDASVEVYTLVTSVQKDGPSVGKIRIGDWIRSVNSIAIQNPQQTYELVKQACKSHTMRLIVQRPIGFSQHPNTVRSKKSDMYAQVTKPPSPLPATPSPKFKAQDPLIPGIIEQKVGPEKVVRQQNIYFSEMSVSNNESQPSVLPFPKTVKFPKVRIFVCGSEAEKYGAYLLRDSDVEPTKQTPGYTHFQFSMATDCSGNVVISQGLTSLYAASSQSNSYMTGTSSSYIQSGDACRCKQCGCDLNAHNSQNLLGSIVNVSLFIIPDDRLFHYCCSYLFTKSSLFILTFDGAKILRSASQEVSRLQSLSHTVRSFAGEECYVMSYGLLNGGLEATNLRDEVKTLFYTQMLNTPLQNYKIIGPELINIQGSRSESDIGSCCDELKRLLWKTVTDSIQHQHVLQPALLIVDYLQSCRDRDVFVTEDHLMSVIKLKLPDYGLDVHQMILTYLNEFGEIIIGKATRLFSQYSIGNIVILNPVFLLSSLYHFICVVSEDKQRWSRTNCTGFFKAADLADISGYNDNEIQCRYLTEFLECVQLIFRKPKLNNVPWTEYFSPYFIPLLNGAKVPECGKKDLDLYVLFNDHESYQTFYQVVFSLVANSDQPDSLTIQGADLCVFNHRGITIAAHFLKTEDRIKLLFRSSEDKNRLTKPFEIYNWLFATCENCLQCSLDIQFSLCAPCPLGENCHNDYQPKPHLVDLKETKPQFCCGDRIDALKAIRQWIKREPDIAVHTVQPQKKPLKLIDLPWSVLNDVYMKLKIPSELDRNWKGLAGLMGLTHEKVQILELEKNPAEELLMYWERTSRKATVERLIEYLEELERVDVIEILQKSLNQSTGGSSSNSNSQTVVENMPHQTLPPINNIPSIGTGGASGCMNMPSQMLPPIKNSNITQRVEANENLLVPPGSNMGSITVAERGIAHIGLEESTDTCIGVGVKLNNLDNNNQLDAVRGICTDNMITPVETPRRSGQIQNS